MAHNTKKPELVAFLKEREEWLWGRTLIATGRSAQAVEAGGVEVPLHHLSTHQDRKSRYGRFLSGP